MIVKKLYEGGSDLRGGRRRSWPTKKCSDDVVEDLNQKRMKYWREEVSTRQNRVDGFCEGGQGSSTVTSWDKKIYTLRS